MHQLKVFRCSVCQAPFLFESSLEDHKKEHAPQVTPASGKKQRKARKKPTS